MKQIILSSVLLALCGCANYQSELVVGKDRFRFPKDSSFTYLRASVPAQFGTFEVTISNAVFKMNPAVIDAKTAHDVAIINSVAQAAGAIAAEAAKTMAKP